MQVYIVYMGQLPSEGYSTESHHLNLLDQVLEGSSARENLVYSYRRSFNGLAAKLTKQEKGKLAGMEDIVSVFPSKSLKPHTTRSWDFLRFPETVRRNPALESDVIVGMLDTGIWPESKSFSDEGFGPRPSKWKGACISLKCNNKIIGARYYNGLKESSDSEESARDFEGHGTHTASTVAGCSVQNTSLCGLAGGTARSAVPSARIAVYKICWTGCGEHDILAAFDDAIADGVDIISISVGKYSAEDYFTDAIAIGAFHAMRKGILVSASGGNAGPGRGTVSNVAPWMLVAAASSTDRHIIDKLVLGNRRTIVGASINTFPTEKRSYPFISADGACYNLTQDMVKGKIVFCGTTGDVSVPFLAGAEGAVMLGDLDYSYSFPLPALIVSDSELKSLTEYINKSRNPVANIHKSEAVFDSNAPVIASFSSRGPNIITPDILKPDISAPGIDILAGWSPKASMSDYENDTRSVMYNIISGTSMACPHVTGAAAYVKSFHPKWSPAAIMSALITTASPMNPSLHQDAELAYGAGQVNPRKAVHPGLVYDATAEDHIKMLCYQGYNTSMIRLITGDKSSCSKSEKGSARDLNYPSMAFFVELDKPFIGKFSRTVTNVGKADSKYTARISSDPKLKVTVEPNQLSFRKLHEKQKFVVTVSGRLHAINSLASASVIWSDRKHSVRSPIIVHTKDK
ncbi:subtilisin-like protease SBT4.3 [Phoenix dactylifera]|uniref:Subtilisin-like protease SBT4.3 n=1 Tax=Phoenix dactylifera TaxID=42345 RepID=A0A8B8JCD7_PHODC|nr:subtilisin-like protease SBT4.3 [Phoenix dactylifera]